MPPVQSPAGGGAVMTPVEVVLYGLEVAITLATLAWALWCQRCHWEAVRP